MIMAHSLMYYKKKLRELDRKIHYLGLLFCCDRTNNNELRELDLQRKEIRNIIKYYNRKN